MLWQIDSPEGKEGELLPGAKGKVADAEVPLIFGTLSEANVGQYEKEAIAVASRTISALEGAIASWEASAAKAAERKEELARCRRALAAFSGWEAEALKAAGDEEDFGRKAERLRRFIRICYHC